jgi:uncharacterized membrane protein YcjF (UPF0283 family)
VQIDVVKLREKERSMGEVVGIVQGAVSRLRFLKHVSRHLVSAGTCACSQ